MDKNRGFQTNRNRNVLINFFVVAGISFISVFFGLKVISGSLLSVQNTMLLLGFCIILGLVSSLFDKLNLRTAYCFFTTGLLIGLVEMLNTFHKDLNGWEDLSALASLFIWIVIGLCSGLLLQFILYLYGKFRRKRVR
jgi:hypothetical protein